MGFTSTELFIIFLIGWVIRPCNNKSVMSEFPRDDAGNCSVSNIKRLSHLAIDPITLKIYIGGINRLAQLNSELGIEQCVVTGPQDDSYLCHARGCDTPDIPIAPTDNVNKVLVVDLEGRSLIACGSVLQGACHKYSLSNISKQSQFFPTAIAANDENSSTYAFIGPKNYDNNWEPSNVLYVGTTFTTNGEYRHDVPAISSRDLTTLELAEFSFSKQSLLRIDVKYRDQFLVDYVYGFNSSDYVYFVVVQKQSHLAGQEELGYVTRLARLCINDANYDSYAEITIQCSTNKKNYNLVQDAKLSRAGDELATSLGIDPGDAVLTATFSPSKTLTNEPFESSALCVYSIADIEAKFNENIHMCFNGSIKYRNMPYISGLILDGNCPVAGSTGNILNFCEVGLKISGITPVKSSPALTYDSVLVTSLTASMAERHNVVFLGTSEGHIKKVILTGPSSATEYKEIEINSGQRIMADTLVSPSGDHLIVLTPNKVVKVPIEDCGSYSNCSACLEAKDPYCGWCSLERKCTVRGACQKATQSAPRWLSYGAGQQCIDFEQILPDRIPITQMTTVSLTIRTLPELPSGTKYRCVFGGSKPVDAGLTENGLSCPTPPLSSRPTIPSGFDHIYVALSVRSSETNKDFVSRNFAYYDCSVHTRCLDCVTSQWACNWCVYENKCSHNTSNCQRNVISGENNPATQLGSHGINACPRFSKSSKQLLLPNRVSKEITLEVENMPSPQVGHSGFQCIVTIEGAKLMVPARMEHQRILCAKTTYTYEANTGEYTAEVSLVWNRNHHVDSMSLILYKCDILGSHRDHPDCSLCVTRQAKYNCAWCSSTCDYAHSCKHYPTTECPKPRIDMIKPLSGPLEGGTLVTIEGSNLGLKEEDVLGKIHVGNTPCNLVEYDVSVRIVCKTDAAKEEKVAMVVVGNQAGFTESAVHFSYKDVKMHSVWPTNGPSSGGTHLAIAGHHLNIGTKTQVFLDDLPCIVNSSQTSSSRLMCITSPTINGPQNIKRLTLIIDGANRTLGPSSFVYRPDPTVLEIKPLKSPISGGRMITVHGTNLNTIQKPQMIVYTDSASSFLNKTFCAVLNSAQMECPSPAVNSAFNGEPSRPKRSLPGKVTDKQSKLLLRIGFIMDGVQSVKDLDKHYKSLRSHITYLEDPNYFQFSNEIKLYKGDTLVIEGEKLNYANDESDVNVTIGTEGCNVTSLASSQLVCSPPQHQPFPTDEKGLPTNIGLPLVVVRVGENLRFPIGYLRYDMVHPYALPPEAMAGIAAGVGCLIFLFVIVLIVYRRKSTQAEREYKRIQIQMDTLESNVRSECKQAFAELQTDMTDLTADLESSGIPTLDHNEYIMKVFFPGVRDHPILHNPKARIMGPTTNYDAAMLQFQQLINNKYFILTFIETLEDQESFSIRDKVNVASLIMVVLIDKMEYATEILRHLLIRLIDKSVGTKHPQLMLRRTESVVEKMLTNWMALSMYRYVKDYAGTPLFLLYKAIKHQIEKGPVDAITHDARYSLSEERLLKEQIPHSVVTVHVVQDDVDEKIQCKVLDCDTISQVKLKILDALYKNTQFSLRPSIHDVDLEWRHGRGGHLTLQDEDLTSKTICGWKRLNTLSHYGVKDSAVMSLISTHSETYNGLCNQQLHNCELSKLPTLSNNFIICSGDYIEGHRVYATSGVTLTTGLGVRESHDNAGSTRVYHLVRPVDDRHGSNQERSHNAIPEIFLTRLLSTKGTIQKFVDDLFMTVLTANSELPPQVKWLFDLFDDHARRHNISDTEVVHAWKSNSLPLRFWVNFIKNPDYVFDINKTTTVDSCLSVIAQTFMDACSTTDHRLGKDSPSNKLLFAKDIPHYREMVCRFYADVANLSPVTDKELGAAMHELSSAQKGYFHVISALKELYIYVTKYSDQIYESLETDAMCKKLNLSFKLETVSRILEGDRSPPC